MQPAAHRCPTGCILLDWIGALQLTTSEAGENFLWTSVSTAIHLMGLFSLSPKQW